MKRYHNRALVGAALAASVGGCATVTPPPPRPVYQHVPCSTPGARPELPVSLDEASEPSDKERAAVARSEQARAATRCVVEVR